MTYEEWQAFEATARTNAERRWELVMSAAAAKEKGFAEAGADALRKALAVALAAVEVNGNYTYRHCSDCLPGRYVADMVREKVRAIVGESGGK
jgi:hypothetical protein